MESVEEFIAADGLKFKWNEMKFKLKLNIAARFSLIFSILLRTKVDCSTMDDCTVSEKYREKSSWIIKQINKKIRNE